ncbi:MAG: TIM barrel protein [Verrucomicrobiota bacterium]
MPQLITGLTSITFRQSKPQEIISLAQKGNLLAIEWGGDIHVPHGHLKTAKEVSKLTKEAGLRVSSYGSYYQIGVSDSQGLNFSKVLDTACELSAPTLRVWAGSQSYANAKDSQKKWIYDETRQICEVAEQAGVTLAVEYRDNTLNDSLEAALDFLDQVNHPNYKTYWQPQAKNTLEECVEELESLVYSLSNVHINSIDYQTGERQALDEASELWTRCFNELLTSDQLHYLLLEFVKDKSPDQFLEDCKTLHRLLEELEISL